jgi:hypothetical protein
MLGPKDLIWSLIPLVLISIFIAALSARCSFSPGGPKAGPVPQFDLKDALHADAATLSFPVREPAVPRGWQPNSGSHGKTDDGSAVTTVGFITNSGRYLALMQSNAAEESLVRYVNSDLEATGPQDVDGRTWVVYSEAGREPAWVTDFGEVRVLISGAGNQSEYTRLADAVDAATPLPR